MRENKEGYAVGVSVYTVLPDGKKVSHLDNEWYGFETQEEANLVTRETVRGLVDMAEEWEKTRTEARKAKPQPR